jgi:hypothetical protein
MLAKGMGYFGELVGFFSEFLQGQLLVFMRLISDGVGENPI